MERSVNLAVAPSTERLQRIEEIEQYLRQADTRDQRHALLLGELGDIYESVGNWSEALRNFEAARQIYDEFDDRRDAAFMRGRIADVKFAQGEGNEALRRYGEVLTLFEKLDDVRSRAVTQGQIADVLQARGQLDEALRIRREEQLPVVERLGDVRDALVCRTNIGLTYLARGSAADRQPALEYLHRALANAQRLRIPETSQIEAIIRQVSDSPQSVE